MQVSQPYLFNTRWHCPFCTSDNLASMQNSTIQWLWCRFTHFTIKETVEESTDKGFNQNYSALLPDQISMYFAQRTGLHTENKVFETVALLICFCGGFSREKPFGFPFRFFLKICYINVYNPEHFGFAGFELS